jgi:hAT family C-terminal dimerisation region
MDSVLSALNENIQEGDKHAEVLYEQMDQTFISATKYLADLTNILKKLINIFQLEHLSLSHFKSQLDTTLKAIQTEFIGSEEIPPNYGTIFKKYLDEHNNFIPQFVPEYSIAIINAIRNRFPESELYGSFSILDPKELPSDDRELALYGNQEIEFLGDFYGETKYINRIEFSKIIDKEKLKQEWDLVKYYLWTYKNNNEEMDFIQLWKHILDTDEDFSFNYPTISLILKIALIIPLSNAQVERIFSQQNLIKNNMRNKMSIDTLSNHLMILLNGPEIEDFDFEKAYKHWEGKKIRRSNHEC